MLLKHRSFSFLQPVAFREKVFSRYKVIAQGG
jgi:hypothetical protein